MNMLGKQLPVPSYDYWVDKKRTLTARLAAATKRHDAQPSHGTLTQLHSLRARLRAVQEVQQSYKLTHRYNHSIVDTTP